MRVAAVDIGTNTVRLLLATAVRQEEAFQLRDPQRHEVITKLGEGLDSSGVLAAAPMQRALDGLAHYADLIREGRVAVRGGVATAATRSAANGEEFADRVGKTLGFHPRVIDGVEEARLTFLGATSTLDANAAYCVIDVGGGSTEFVCGHEHPESAASIDIGSVRLTERIVALGLRDPGDIRAYVDDLFAGVAPPVSPSLVLGSGGTYVTLAAVARHVLPQAIEAHGEVVLSFDELQTTVDRLLGMTVEQVALLPEVPAARAEVLQAGAICAERAVARIGAAAVRISVSDILDGLAMEMAAQEWPEAEAPGR